MSEWWDIFLINLSHQIFIHLLKRGWHVRAFKIYSVIEVSFLGIQLHIFLFSVLQGTHQEIRSLVYDIGLGSLGSVSLNLGSSTYFTALGLVVICMLGLILSEIPGIYSEKAMAPNSSTLAWKIPWTEEPGRLQSMGSLKVGHDWATWLSLFTFLHWRRKWQPTPVFLPGESQGRGSLVCCCLWGRTESDTTEVT